MATFKDLHLKKLLKGSAHIDFAPSFASGKLTHISLKKVGWTIIAPKIVILNLKHYDGNHFVMESVWNIF